MNFLIATQSSYKLDIYLTVVNRYLCLVEVARLVLDTNHLVVVHLLRKIKYSKA